MINNDDRSDSIRSSHFTHTGSSANSNSGRCYRQSDNMNSKLADVQNRTEAVASPLSIVLVHPYPMLQTAHCPMTQKCCPMTKVCCPMTKIGCPILLPHTANLFCLYNIAHQGEVIGGCALKMLQWFHLLERTPTQLCEVDCWS